MPLRQPRPAPAAGSSGPRDRLDAADPAERRRAAQALAGQPRAVPRLGARLAIETDRAVRAALLDALVAIGSDTALGAVTALLTAEEPGARAAAFEAIARIEDARAVTLLLPLLDDAAADRRVHGLTALADRRDPLLVARLMRLLGEETDANVCAAAADLLGRQGDAAARPALLRLKARFRAEPFLQFATDAALARLAEA
ncbi:HEAT repeat domain-containing protein [Sphingomonas elodea]|uniref:HEAT repeat domain-containing protein n=1 Tax=Sphingomonas elodea TaxID=179878 RepID=UPI000263070E|nr:HEAT repeat domain-containing protein [Sphingomonas elodea]